MFSTNPFDEKILLKEENERRLLHYYLSDTLTHNIYPHSNVPGRLFSGHVIPYERQRVQLGENSLHIIKKEGEFNHFIWRTTPEHFNQAIDDGIIPVDTLDALSAKVLQSLGGYVVQTRKRLYNSGIISQKVHEKYVLLRLTQSRVKMLQPIERLINNANPAITEDEQLNLLKRELQNYKQSIQSHLSQLDDRYNLLTVFDRQALKTLRNYLQKDIARIDNYLSGLKPRAVTQYYNASGRHSLGGFIKEEMIRFMREAQALNQNLIYARHAGSFLRGDFNGVCEDALKEINLYRPDLHNPVLKEHQGIFPKSDKKLSVNFQTLGKDARAIERTLMGITQIEGEDKLLETNGGFYLSKETGSPYPILSTNKTKWAINEPRWYSGLRVAAWTWNVGTGICLGLTFDLIVGLGMGLLGHKPPSLASKFQIKLPIQARKNTTYKKLMMAMEPPTYSLGTLVGFKLSNFVKNVAWDLLNGATTTLKQLKFELWENLITDYQIGHHGHPAPKDVHKTLSAELEYLRTKKKESLTHIDESSQHFKQQVINTPASLSAVPPYRLSHGEWLDITNEAIHGMRFVAETFTHNIHSKHPLLGLVFSTAYLSGIFVILTPKFMSFMPKSYLHFSNVLANAMSKGGVTKAIGSGMTQAQLFSAAFNVLIEGNDSWLSQGSKALEKNPSNILVYITLAVGLGALIAFELDIPYISETLRDDLGNIPIPSLGFAGAKIGILLVDLLQEKKPEEIKEHLPVVKDELDNIIQSFTEIQEKQQRDELIETLLSDEFLCQFQQQVVSIQQGLDTIQKTELKKVAFLFKLEKEKEFLPLLSTRLKRDLLILTQRYFPGHKETLKTVQNLLYPPPPQSIFIITLTTVIYYIPLFLRCMLVLVTFNPAPFYDLKDKVTKDLTRLGVASANAIHGLTSFLKTGFRGIFDVLGNEIVARIASFIADDTHPISSSTYSISTQLDVQFEHLSQTLSEPIEHYKKQTTFATPFHVFKQESLRFVKACKPEPREMVTADASSEGLETNKSQLLSTNPLPYP